MRGVFARPAAAAAIMAFAAGAAIAEQGPTVAPYTYRAIVMNVVNGDTIDLNIDLGFYIWAHGQRIRLHAVDAPEPAGDTKAAGDAATAYLTDLLKGKTIILKSIMGPDSPDRRGSFGDWYGVVWLDGVNINEKVVADGHARAAPTP